MSFIETEEKYRQKDEKSSNEITLEADSEESYLTEEEILNESFSESINKLEDISIDEKSKNSDNKIHKGKNGLCKLNVSLRYGKRNHFFKTNKKTEKIIQRKLIKKINVKSKKRQEKPVENSKKGKRCRIGGKAKAKPPEEENHDKHESDEENENYFFSRISLGFFQKFKDLSGASTSNQWEENYNKPLPAFSNEKVRDEISDEMELLELQNWGMAKSIKFENEFLNPDRF